jgi:hypothetical protein
MLLNVGYGQQGFKKINLCKGRITVDVPDTWEYQDHYMTYADYEIKSDEKISDRHGFSVLTINMYDSIYRKKVFINEERIKFEREQDSVRFKKVIFEKTGIKNVNNIKVGFLKYTLNHGKSKRSYMIKCILKDLHGFFYEIEIYNFNKPEQEFRATADRIFDSLSFNFN